MHRDTQLVTLSIGGNDSDVFVDLVEDCSQAGTSTGGQGSPCQDEYGDSFDRTIDSTTYRATVRTLRAIRARAPRARIAILSYPWIMPRAGGCYPSMPIATGDVPYFRGVQRVLNAEVGRAAKAAGVRFVNLNRVSDGHDACQPEGVRWIEPVYGGTNPVVVHPNALGERRMAAQVRKVLHL